MGEERQLWRWRWERKEGSGVDWSGGWWSRNSGNREGGRKVVG